MVTHDAPAVGKQASVLAWSESPSFLIQTLDLCDFVSH
jgi:hypothetical protein